MTYRYWLRLNRAPDSFSSWDTYCSQYFTLTHSMPPAMRDQFVKAGFRTRFCVQF